MDVDFDESSESTVVLSNVTPNLVAPTPKAVPSGKAATASGRGTAAATSLRGTAMDEVPGSPMHSSADSPGGFAVSTLAATSAGITASGRTISPIASVE